MDDTHPEVEQRRATITQAAAATPVREGQRSVEVLSHGTMVVRHYALHAGPTSKPSIAG